MGHGRRGRGPGRDSRRAGLGQRAKLTPATKATAAAAADPSPPRDRSCVERPPHVPELRVFDFDVYALDLSSGDYPATLKALLHQAPEIFWTPRNGGHWVVTRADDIEAVLADHELYSSRRLAVPKARNPHPPFPPAQSDPPEHGKYRGLLVRALTPAVIAELGQSVRARAAELIEALRPAGRCDLIADVAQMLPIHVFMTLADLPDADLETLVEIAKPLVSPAGAEVAYRANLKMAAYLTDRIEERRARPGSDVISALATASLDGEPIGDHGAFALVCMLLVAGLDTVTAMTGQFARVLALDPALRRRLVAEPQRIPAAVEELLRRHGVSTVGREVTRAHAYKDVRFEAGDMIVAPTALSGVDERRFERPLDVDLDRPRGRHAAFGAGVHHCPGSTLARAMLGVFAEEWLARIPEFGLDPRDPPTVLPGINLAVARLPLVWPG